jgi:hypothetical protein
MNKWLRAAVHCDPIRNWVWKGQGKWPDVMLVVHSTGPRTVKRRTKRALTSGDTLHP